MIIEKCLICGHLKKDHFIGHITKADLCMECHVFNPNHRHKFQLDNLKLIEDLAMKKKLI